MASKREQVFNFMNEYFQAFSEDCQVAERQSVMDKYYAPDLVIDDNMMTSREQWYRACLSHPGIKDVLVCEHMYFDEEQSEVGVLVTTQYIERATGEDKVDLKMHVLYNLRIKGKDIKIAKFRVYVQSDVEKLNKMFAVMRGSRPAK